MTSADAPRDALTDAREPIALIGPDGARAPARGLVYRHGPAGRWSKAVAFVVGGLVLGAGCIIVPGLHLITTWGLPLLGLLLGLRAYRCVAEVHEIEGVCPACGEAVGPHGGRVTGEPLTTTCPRCTAAIRVEVNGQVTP